MNNSIPKVSIILPVHNAGIYLKKSLDTIVNQTLQEIEIIIILDCPTDGSDTIIYDYAKKDSRIKVIENKENLHVGLSRNKALEMATGEYIAFSDHDDWRELNMYELLLEKAKRDNLDMVLSTPTMFYSENDIQTTYLPQTTSYYIKNYLLTDLIGWGNYSPLEQPAYCFIQFNLYKAEIIKRNHIRFVDTCKYSPEDVFFNIEFLFYAEKIDILPGSLYYHRELMNSEGHGYSYKSWQKRIQGMEYMYRFLNENLIFKQFETNFYIYITKESLNVLLRIITNRKSPLEFIKATNNLKKHQFIKDAFAHYNPSNINRGNIKNGFRKLLSHYLK